MTCSDDISTFHQAKNKPGWDCQRDSKQGSLLGSLVCLRGTEAVWGGGMKLIIHVERIKKGTERRECDGTSSLYEQ